MCKDFYEVVNARRTIRDYENISIDDEVIERIVSSGMKAPTNDHMRDWHFIIIKDKHIVLKLVSRIPEHISTEEVYEILRDWNLNDACQQNAYIEAIPKQYQMLAQAACVIIPLFKQKTDVLHPENLSHLNGFASIWCCIENMLLAITAEGYSSALRIPLGEEGDWARKVLSFPENYLMPCFIAVGKASENACYVKQKEYSITERIHKDIW
ncbi:MAG: nitroreductase family protein [Clostridium sp.]|uniref:nitroreductase family protein n=1 Tax=Clostridium sp. TaxID=1506 RepID=UPI00290753BB|nr:nitroreductase family protein [Clostridium sp.]MDU7338689.1 nitroreductase family protein [Clostridium sp.]